MTHVGEKLALGAAGGLSSLPGGFGGFLGPMQLDNQVAAPPVLGNGQNSERHDRSQAGGGQSQEASVQVPVAYHAEFPHGRLQADVSVAVHGPHLKGMCAAPQAPEHGELGPQKGGPRSAIQPVGE